MTDLLLRFTPETTIRGTTTVDESGQAAYSVYDFIEFLGRPCFRKKKRGDFSRRIWKRLIWKHAHKTKEIESWSFEAPIRISAKVNRKFQSPVMTVCGLRKLWDLLKDMFYVKFLEDWNVGPDNAGKVFNVVKVTLERYLAGDHSMVEEIQTDESPSAVGAKRASEGAAETSTPNKKKRASPDTGDLVLVLPGGMTVRGTTAPSAPACMFWDNDVPGEVFAVYDFIDAIVRQTSCVATYANISRVLWKRLSTEETMEAAELRGMSMQAPMRYSLQSSRRFLTPAMGLRGLYRLFQFINYDFKVNVEYPGPTRTKGRRAHMRELDKVMCSGLYELFKQFHDGDRSIVSIARGA